MDRDKLIYITAIVMMLLIAVLVVVDFKRSRDGLKCIYNCNNYEILKDSLK